MTQKKTWNTYFKYIIFNNESSVVTGVYSFGRVCLPVCLYVCRTITFKSLDVGTSFLHIQFISRVYGSSSY